MVFLRHVLRARCLGLEEGKTGAGKAGHPGHAQARPPPQSGTCDILMEYNMLHESPSNNDIIKRCSDIKMVTFLSSFHQDHTDPCSDLSFC